jgi:hypothetical protein
MGYDPFCLWVIHKEGLCPSSGDINKLMMILELGNVNKLYIEKYIRHITRKQTGRHSKFIVFAMWVIHKEGLCPSSGDINRLMMIMMMSKIHNTYILCKEFDLDIFHQNLKLYLKTIRSSEDISVLLNYM